MAATYPEKERHWTERISRSSYFIGALLLHLIVLFLVATCVIFPAFHPPADDFTKTYLPPSSPPPPPPPATQTVQVPTHVITPPSTVITSTAPMAFNVPMPDITVNTTSDTQQAAMTQKPATNPDILPAARLVAIRDTEETNWGRPKNNILEAGGDPRNVTATFPVFLASYANGDWACNTHFSKAGKIDAGSLPDLIAKMNEWSHGQIKGEVIPTPLNIGGPDLLDKKPPFIFFTGHKDFVLTDQEIQNLRDYLQVGGAIWGDNALAGRGSRFDVAFRREMKRVVPDLDKNFEPVATTDPIFTKSWFPITQIPSGMNYYAEPLEHLDIDGKLAILYTPNDYSDMFYMRILPGDTQIQGGFPDLNGNSPLFTNGLFLDHSIFFRNFTLPTALACQQLGMNIIGHFLVRFDDALLLTP